MTTEVDPLDSLPSGVKLLLRHLHALIPKKLSDINYPTWKITVLTALEANYLLKYVDGSTEPPPAVITATDKSEKTNPAHAAWKAVDGQIRSCLIAVISPTVQKHVRSYTTASALWTALATRYASISHSHIFQLRDRLHTITKGTKTMAKYLDEVSTIITALDTMNEIIPEKDLVMCVVRGFPLAYSSIKQVVRISPTPVDLATLSSWLKSEEINVDLESKLLLRSRCYGASHRPHRKPELSRRA